MAKLTGAIFQIFTANAP